MTINNCKKTICVLFCLFFLTLSSWGQEVITGLQINKPLAREALKERTTTTRAAALHLPFVDDFSNYTGYPDPALWQDRKAFVNRTFALQPPTMGVATLDALDEDGRVYPHAEAAGFCADNLTSQPIRLDYNFDQNRPMREMDSLYLSFYYQPAGGSLTGVEWERLGNRPERHDSLILEFGYATGETIVVGYEYCNYFLDEDESYMAGDTLINPYLPNDYYIFETPAFPGDAIQLPCEIIYGPEMYWENVWSTPGESLDDWLRANPLQYFKQVMIPITDTRWFINNFQFRFRNLASLEDNAIVGWASNVDQWNLDYVYLSTNRTAEDCYPNDVAFVMPTTSILRKYQAMPWSQYRDSDLATGFQNRLSNLSDHTKNSYYTYRVQKEGGGQVAAYTPNNENAFPYYNNGLHQVEAHASPAFNFHALPTDAADSATFVITHIFQETGTNDQRRCNDTCIFEQKFNNFYAYDDGTAEAGYSILSTLTNPEAFFAMRFTLAQPDTLRAVRMWFNSVLEDANIEEFTLMVWDDANGIPGNVIYEQPNELPAYATPFTDFTTYYLQTPVAVSGTFYVGFYQTHNVQLNLGFDQNTDSRGHFLYKTTSEWRTPFLKGTPMVRPVVGAPLPIPESIAENTITDQLTIYPNPATTSLYIAQIADVTFATYRIFDAFGRVMDSKPLLHNNISISHLPTGMFILQVVDNNGASYSTKFVKQ